MYDIEKLSFHTLSERELLKGWAWWLGFIATVMTAAAAYTATNPA